MNIHTNSIMSEHSGMVFMQKSTLSMIKNTIEDEWIDDEHRKLINNIIRFLYKHQEDVFESRNKEWEKMLEEYLIYLNKLNADDDWFCEIKSAVRYIISMK